MVCAMHLGFVDLWKDGYYSVHEHNKRQIVNDIFDIAPDDMTVMVRCFDFLSAVSNRKENQFP